MADLAELNLLDAARAIRERELSPVELTEHYLARIDETEPAVHAYVTVDAEGARRAARAAEAAVTSGETLGPLHGVPLGVKDLFDTAGVRTTYGSPAWERHIPARDATAVARLRAAGAVILGKHATHELAWGGRTDSAHFGPTHNPHRRDHIPGGSSGGSAASVVAGSSLGAIGTDTAGSVRIPAALCGCVGFKPTRGRVSLAGAMPLAPSLDHVGALARTVADAAAIIDAIAGPDPADPGTHLLVPADAASAAGRPLRAAFLSGWPTDLLDPDIAAALSDVEHRLPRYGVAVASAKVAGEAPAAAILTRILAEAGMRHRPAYERCPEAFGADVGELLRLAPPTTDDLVRTQLLVARTTAALLEILVDNDVLVLPTVPMTAPRIGAATVAVDARTVIPIELVLTRLTSIFDAAGLPAISVPAGMAHGLPLGAQVVGRPGADESTVAVAAVIEELMTERST